MALGLVGSTPTRGTNSYKILIISMDQNLEKKASLQSPQKKSRRDALGAVGLYSTAALAAAAGIVSTSIETPRAGEIKINPPIRVGNLNLTIMETEHTRADWEVHQGAITAEMRKFPIMIPEYFPPERENILTNGGLVEKIPAKIAQDVYREQQYLFEEVARQCQETNKGVWVLDPAYNSAFIFFRELLQLPDTTAQSAILLSVGNKIWNMYSESGKKLSRRGMLTKTALGAGIIAASAEPYPGELSIPKMLAATFDAASFYPFIEVDFRRVMIAEFISKLGQHLANPNEALMIYPKEHAKEIIRYLLDEDERKKRLDIYQEFKKVKGLEMLFRARHYAAEGQTWVLDDEMNI